MSVKTLSTLTALAAATLLATACTTTHPRPAASPSPSAPAATTTPAPTTTTPAPPAATTTAPDTGNSPAELKHEACVQFLALMVDALAMKDADPTWSLDKATNEFLDDWNITPEAAAATPAERDAFKAGITQASKIAASGGTTCP